MALLVWGLVVLAILGVALAVVVYRRRLERRRLEAMAAVVLVKDDGWDDPYWRMLVRLE